MKLYDYKMAPSPRRVRIFLAEKNVTDLEVINIDLGKAETRTKEFKEKNPYLSVPLLELDSGEHISESMAICRYFEETVSENPLFGTDALSKTQIEMWNRRIEFALYLPIAFAFRHGNEFWAKVMKQSPEFAEISLEDVDKQFHMFNKHLEGKEYVTGNAFSVADITLLCSIDFAKVIQRRIDPEKHSHLAAWHKRISERPSAQA